MREQDFIINKPEQYPRPRERRSVDDGTVELHLKNLPPYSEITLQVRVLNKYYASRASNRISFTTKESSKLSNIPHQVFRVSKTNMGIALT